jgi:hypothetical protein
MVKLNETNIPQNFSTGMYNDKGYDISRDHTSLVADILFTGVSECLGDIKTKEQPVAFVFKKNNDEFIAAAVVQYIENKDDKNQAGAWSYVWTWNQEDVPKNAKLVGPEDANLGVYFRGVSKNKYGAAFRDQAAIIEVTRYFLETLSKWLDENAVDTEEIAVEEPGVFQAAIVIENDQRIKSLVPEGEIKKLIKDDSAIEV